MFPLLKFWPLWVIHLSKVWNEMYSFFIERFSVWERIIHFHCKCKNCLLTYRQQFQYLMPSWHSASLDIPVADWPFPFLCPSAHCPDDEWFPKKFRTHKHILPSDLQSNTRKHLFGVWMFLVLWRVLYSLTPKFMYLMWVQLSVFNVLVKLSEKVYFRYVYLTLYCVTSQLLQWCMSSFTVM